MDPAKPSPMTLDARRLADLVDYLGRDIAAEMTRKAIDGLGRNMTELRGTADHAAARRLAHTIRGLASMYGLSDVAVTALSLEAADQAAKTAGIAELDRLVGEAIRDLTSFVSGLGGTA